MGFSFFPFNRVDEFKLSRLHKSSYFHVYHQYANNHVEQLHNNKLTKFQRKFEFRFLNSDKIDAFVDIRNKKIDCVYITYGFVVRLHDLFYKLFCNASVFPAYGSAVGFPSEAHLAFKPYIQNKTVFYLAPTDETRKQLAQFCSSISMQFAILHEIGHHMNGHELYRIHKTGPITKLERQVLEMDADAFAVTNSIQAAFLTEEHRQMAFPDLQLSNIEYIRLWIYLVHIFFLFMSREHDFIYKERMELKYLPRRIRSLLAAQISFELFDKFYPQEPHDFQSLFVDTFHQAERDYNSTFHQASSAAELESCFSDDMLSHLDEINQYWRHTMVHRLAPYARVPLFQQN
ncbi:hypothetical protein [Paenibacillus rigui]|uniref:Peptidase n=1 Tax=Paenibacillus rigui TaxID=554312 RepID=A0A229UPC3_9BACL|nr:hypothetical protein [Paenibacillus rigui]OXM85272.1 hypothetical protein CF651_16920 [Paenibacillus rigui]